MRREMRGLVPAEAAVVLAAAMVSLPIPAVVPLLVFASASMWLRGRSWAEVAGWRFALFGVAAGVVALVLALFVSTPIAETLTEYAVQWSTYPVVRGSSAQLSVVAIMVAISAVAAELVLRGWIVERVLELRGHPVLAVLAGAFAEALIAGGDITARIGAGLFGIGLGWMYVSAGRSVVAPICARAAFSLGALLLEAMRVIG